MQGVATLRPAEPVEIDHGRVHRMRQQQGAQATEARICTTLEELAYRLYHFDRAWRAVDGPGLTAQARRIADLAGEVGLISVHHVAEAAARAGGLHGHAAAPMRAALAARLVRVGEASILEVWDLQDQSL